VREGHEPREGEDNPENAERSDGDGEYDRRHDDGEDSTDAVQRGVVDDGYTRQDVGRCQVVACKGDAVDQGKADVPPRDTSGNDPVFRRDVPKAAYDRREFKYQYGYGQKHYADLLHPILQIQVV